MVFIIAALMLTFPALAQERSSAWMLDAQCGFGENLGEALSWGGSDALLYGAGISFRRELSPDWNVGVGLAYHNQFLVSTPLRWFSLPFVAEYHTRAFYAEGGFLAGVSAGGPSSDQLFRLGGFLSSGYRKPIGDRLVVKVGLSTNIVEEYTRVFDYDDNLVMQQHHTWFADADLQLVVSFQYHL